MNNSFKADELTINKIMDFYRHLKVENNNDSVIFAAKDSDFSVLIYKTGTVYFQGKKAHDEKLLWHDDETNYENIVNMGSDEVGCGDYFGPVVVVASLVTTDNYDLLVSLGVNDSKKITDTKIREIAPILRRKIRYASFVLSDKKYNQMVDMGYNLNKIKAYLHNFVLTKLKEKTNYEGLIVVDDFCTERLYYKYLEDQDVKITDNITFKTKAESSYLSVAVSSIIARYIFLEKIDKMREKLHYEFPLGGGPKATEAAISIAKDKGMNYLKKNIKYHFKNTKEVLVSLSDNGN